MKIPVFDPWIEEKNRKKMKTAHIFEGEAVLEITLWIEQIFVQ